MRSVTDQQGNVIPWSVFLDRLAEAILANVIALEQAGVPQDEVRIMVGQDGVTVKAGKAVLQTPIESRLTDEEGRELVDVFARLDKQHRSGASLRNGSSASAERTRSSRGSWRSWSGSSMRRWQHSCSQSCYRDKGRQ